MPLESPLQAIEPGIVSPPLLSQPQLSPSSALGDEDSTVPAGIGPLALIRHRARWNVFDIIKDTLPHQAEKKRISTSLGEWGLSDLSNPSISDPWARTVSPAPVSTAINVCLSQAVRAQYTLTTRAIWSIALHELHILDTLRSLRYWGGGEVLSRMCLRIL